MSKRLFFILAIALMLSGLYVRHQNGQEATKRAKALQQLDASGQDPTASLAALKQFVNGHMGAQASGTLAVAYAKAQAAAQAAAQAQAANSQIYADAQRICGGKSDSITQAKCNQDYLSKHLVAIPNTGPITAPDPAVYTYSFKSPLWTADLAGVLALGGLLVLVWLIITGRRRRRA
jgi:hypothetical protein